MKRFSGFMARFAIAALCVITLGSCAVAPKKPDKFTPGDYSFVKRHISWLIKREADKRGIRGVSIALIDSGETVWAEGFGWADEAGKKPATERTLYRVGSISKLFTMLGVMRLSENGRVNIDGAIADYIPGFSIKTRFADTPPITIRNVLTHHSGLPSDYAKGMWTDKPERLTSLIPFLKEEYVANPPGLVFSYSNVGFTLLGAVIENASGSRYEDYMDTHLLGPIGMKNSAFEIKPAMETFVSKAYTGNKEERLWPLRDIPAGGLYSNVTDLARFASHIMSGSGVVSDESLIETLKPQNVGVKLDFDYRVGLSWMLSWPGLDYAGPVINHSGATIAHRSVLAIIPGHKLGVVVLANTASAQGVVNMIAAETLKLALEVKTGIKPPRKKEEQPKEVEVSVEKLEEYAGYYVAGPQMAHVTAKDGRLYAKVAGLNGKVELIPREGGVFTGAYKAFGFLPIYVKELEGLSLSIERVNGRSALLAHVNGARFLIGEKVEPVSVPGPWLARLGEYELLNIGEDFPGAPNKATLSYENGFLVVNSVSAFLGGVSASVPIRPVSDTEALIYGLGRGRGETVRIIERNGDDIAIVSGYEYKRKKKKG